MEERKRIEELEKPYRDHIKTLMEELETKQVLKKIKELAETYESLMRLNAARIFATFIEDMELHGGLKEASEQTKIKIIHIKKELRLTD